MERIAGQAGTPVRQTAVVCESRHACVREWAIYAAGSTNWAKAVAYGRSANLKTISAYAGRAVSASATSGGPATVSLVML
jgi:hypothetical protein